MKPLLFLPLVLCLAAPTSAFTAEERREARNAQRFEQTGPKPGQRAPDFSLQTIDGRAVHAAELWAKRPMLLMTGSYTCPVFRGHVQGFDGLVRKFGDQLSYVVVYTQEAHPKGDPSPYSGREWLTPANEKEGILIPQPTTLPERASRAKKCVEVMKLTVPVAVDAMDNATWKAYGSAPNCAYLIAPDGKVAAQQGWFDPRAMEAAITRVLKGGN